MNEDVEQLVREGLDRLAVDAEVPAGLVGRARRRCRRRRLAVGSAIAGGIAAVTAVAVIAATGAAAGPAGQASTSGVTRAQMDAFVVLRHMESAFAQQDLVMRGDVTGTSKPGPETDRYIIWSYRNQFRFMAFWAGKPNWDDGTALIGGKLLGAHVTYYNRKWSASPLGHGHPLSNACGKSAVAMSIPPPGAEWAAFIKSTLACRAATEAGHVWINGVDTIEIAGLPYTTGLPKGMVAQTKARVTYRLYVNPSTYLPVRMSSTTYSYGPKTASFAYTSVTDIRWLPPTAANVSQTLVTIPAGFRHMKSEADQ